jgi:peptide/nickel transport system substrate-binding protein
MLLACSTLAIVLPAASGSATAGAGQSPRTAAARPAVAPRATCNSKKIVATYYSEPSILDFQQFGTDGDNDVRGSTIGTLLSRKFVKGKYPTTTNGVTGQYVGNDASSWNFDKKTKVLTFHLRKGLRFADGSLVTSSDVKFSFVRGLEDPLSYLPSVMKLLTITSANQITTPNRSTVEFHFKKFNPFTYELMSIWATGILSEKFVEAHATKSDPWANAYLVNHMESTGPYVLSAHVTGVSYTLTPNPYYWDKAQFPCNGGVTILVTPNASDRELLVERGAVDIARSINYQDIPQLKKNPNIQVLDYSTADMRELGLNVKVKPFNNLTVRRAIAYAIPYSQILKTVWAGAASPLKSIVPPNMPTTAPKTWPYFTDLKKAKQLLAKAGYPHGFSTQLFTRSTDSDDQTAAVLIAASLAKIGVNVSIQRLTTAQYSAKQFGQRNMPMFFWDWISFVNDPYYDFTFLTQCGQGTNYVNFCSKKVDSLIADGLFDSNLRQRAAISSQVQSIVADAACDIGLGTPDSIVVMGKDLHGWNQQVDLNARYYTLYKS